MPATMRDHTEATIMTRSRMVLTLMVAGFTLAGGGCVDDLALPPLPPPPPKEAELVHYWHFNALPTGTLTSVPVDVSKLTGAVITYPGTGAGYMDNVDPGTALNAQLGQPAGLGLRPRNPANTRELLITAPSTGYEKLVVSYAVQRSGSGAAQEEFYYSINGGTTWVILGAAFDISEEWAIKTFDLSTVTAVNNNANLRFRIRFVGANSDGSSGNNRLDNIVIEGVPVT
jgi:hypothetical protein